MDTYQNLRHKIHKGVSEDLLVNKSVISLFDYDADENIVPASERELIEALCNDFKEVLEIEDLSSLIHEIFKIENQISFLNDKGKNVPDLSIFYQNLSPVLLRSLWEVLNDGEVKSEDLLSAWKEAIRIAIEEEFYIWQEKIIS